MTLLVDNSRSRNTQQTYYFTPGCFFYTIACTKRTRIMRQIVILFFASYNIIILRRSYIYIYIFFRDKTSKTYDNDSRFKSQFPDVRHGRDCLSRECTLMPNLSEL